MYKVLIADDEVWIRRRLSQIIDWKGISLECCGNACDGIEAYDTAVKMKPDILITDVRMPGMDGLQLSERLMQTFDHLKVIVVSGYEEFDYAKKAIQLEAVSYILKPVNDVELNEILRKAVKQIKEKEDYTDFLNSGPEILEKLLEDHIIKRKPQAIVKLKQRLEKQYGIDCEYCVVLIQAEILKSAGNEFAVKLKECSETVGEGDFSLELFCKGHSLIGALIVNKSKKDFKVYLRRLYDEVRIHMGDRLYICVGQRIGDLAELWSSYKQAEDVLNEREANHGGGVCFKSESRIREFQYPLELHKKLITYVSTGDTNRIAETLGPAIESFRSAPGLLLQDIRKFYFSVISDVIKIIREFTVDTQELLNEGYGYCRILDQTCELTKMHEWLGLYLAKVSEFLRLQHGSEIEQVIEKIKVYVQLNYGEQTSLDELAALFHVNASYLSRAFKEKTGVTFIKYLTKIRMEAAKDLLEKSNVKISEISRMVGYDDSKYFSSLYREYSGKLPMESREKKQP